MLTGKANLFCLPRGQIVQTISLDSQEIAELCEANNFILDEGKWPNLKCQRSAETFLTDAEKEGRKADLVATFELEDVAGSCTK
jgi:hypothetical protein